MKRSTLILLVIGGAALVATTAVYVTNSGEAPPLATGTANVTNRAPPSARDAMPPAPPEPMLSASTIRALETRAGRVSFEERRYLPEYPLTRLQSRPPDAWLTSPEAVLSSLFSAMQAVDWDWAMSLFEPSDDGWRDRWAADKSHFLASWSKYANRAWVLTKRHDIPGYAMIYVRRTDHDQEQDPFPYALRQDERGRWWLTHDLDQHAVKNLAMIEGKTRRPDDATP